MRNKMFGKRKLAASIAAGTVAVALGIGGFAMAGGSSSNGASATPSAPSAAGADNAVIPFQPGQPGAAKTVGQVPADFTQGSGTIVTGAAADKAKAAAVAAYPGGTVNRVVLLSSGDYNVHIIGVNWPHHVFVNKTFEVIGAL
jgi:hypothetical protein